MVPTCSSINIITATFQSYNIILKLTVTTPRSSNPIWNGLQLSSLILFEYRQEIMGYGIFRIHN